MIKRIKEKNYKFKSAFGNVVISEVEMGISESGRRSLAVEEIKRLSRLAAIDFYKANYSKALDRPEFILSEQIARAIMIFLNVNQVEFAKLIGCQKAKVSKILSGDQEMSKAQTLLALERLGAELARPGATRKLLKHDDTEIPELDEAVAKELTDARFRAA